MVAGRIRAALLATALVLSGAVVAQPAQAADSTDWLATVQDSSTITAANSTILSGQFLTASGATFSANSRVELIVQPPPETEDALAVGQSVTMPAVAKALTSATGRFTMRLVANNDLGQYASADGNINFILQGYQGTDIATYSFTRTFVPYVCPACRSAANATAASSGSPAMLLPTEVDRLDNAAVSHALANPDTVTVQGLSQDPSVISTMPGVQSTQTCVSTKVKSYPNELVLVGSSHVLSGVTKVTSHFTYETNHSTAIGYAVSISGSHVGYSQAGTYTGGGGRTLNFQTFTTAGNYTYYANFHWGKFKYTCTNIYDTKPYITMYTVKATSQTVGQDTRTASAPAASSDCGKLPFGTGEIEHSAHAYDFSNSATIQSVVDDIGISLTSRAGYSKDTQLDYENVATRTDRTICGGSGKKVYVKA